MGNKGVKTVFTRDIQDRETGETIKTIIFQKYTTSPEQFMRVFPRDLDTLARCSGAEITVVLCVMKFLEYNTNLFILTADRRAELSSRGNIKKPTVAAAIGCLMKQNIFIKKSSSTYILNPLIFFYGEEREREKIIASTSEYKLGGGMGTKNPLGKKK